MPLRVHGKPVNVPVPLLPNETLPVGVVAPVPLVSITVAVHVTDPPMFMEAGLQLTEVLVGAGLTMTVVVLVLAA